MRNKIKLFFVALPLVAIIGLIGYFVIWPMLQPDSSNSEEESKYVCLSQQKVNELNFTDESFISNKKKFDDCLASLQNAENHQLDSIDCINNARETLYGKFMPKCIEHYKNYFTKSTWSNLSGVQSELQQYLDALTNIDANSSYVNTFLTFRSYINSYYAAQSECAKAQHQKTVESYTKYANWLNYYANLDPLCNNKDIKDKINNAKLTAQNAVASTILTEVRINIDEYSYDSYQSFYHNAYTPLYNEIKAYRDIPGLKENPIILDAFKELEKKRLKVQDRTNKTSNKSN